jgi:hypothetical protein
MPRALLMLAAGLVVLLVAVAAFAVYEDQQISALQSGRVTLAGVSYRTVAVSLAANLTAISFHGINLSFSYGFVEGDTLPVPAQFRNSTDIVIPCPVHTLIGGVTLCQELFPQVQVTFPDGAVEYFDKVTITNSTQNSLEPLYTYGNSFRNSPSTIWFSAHSNPKVAIMVEKGNVRTMLTLYVSE